MYDSATVQNPLAIDRVERTRGQGDKVGLRLTGRWLADGSFSPRDALLVIQLQGRRHRFPANRREESEVGPGGPSGGSAWVASFTVPDWAVPQQSGQAALWVGDTVIPVPPPGAVEQAAAVQAVASPEPPPADPGQVAGPAPVVGQDAPAPLGPDPGADAGRGGPLADLLFKETVSALHSELEQRSSEAARLRGALADARSDLEARGATGASLEAAHAELRHELQQLMAAVADQRAEFDEQLAAMGAERDEARTAGESEVARVRDEANAEAGRIRAEAESELTRVRADAETESTAEMTRVRSESEAETARIRAESAAELARVRAESDAELTRVRAEGEARLAEAQGHLAELEARAASLDQRLAGVTVSDRRRADEVAALREQLAGAHIVRDAAISEADGLRAELERLAGELAVTREQTGVHGADLDEAQRLLADARALTEQLRGPAPS
jgi:F0F1-type ATP synthase membrane subunit b/b'